MAITVLDTAPDRAKAVRRTAFDMLRSLVADHGDNLAGFAAVTWDMRGETRSAACTGNGVVGRSLMPALAHDALNRLLTVATVAETDTEAP